MTDLFGFKKHPAPKKKKAPVPVKPRSTNAERFEKFHRENPHVLRSIIRIARDLQGRGFKRGSISLIFERLRWLSAIETKGDPFKLSNTHRAFYVRVAEALCPKLEGFFRTAEQKSPYHPRWDALEISPEDFAGWGCS